jgi:signal transduction histidine kinase
MGVRMRYTILYGAMFLVSAAALLAILAGFGLRDTDPAAPMGSVPPGEQVARLREQLADADQAHARQLLVGAVVALVVMLVVSLLLGRVVAGRVLRPLRTITAATRRITADSLHERLGVRGPADEVKALADTIDNLLERLEDSFAAQRRFVADASHELRTPLATMRASIDVAMAKPGPVPPQSQILADRLHDSLDQVESLLEGLLVLARAQHGALDDRTVVSLAELAEEAVEARRDEIKGLRLYAGTAAPADTAGNRVLLARMVGNVIDNAVRHNVAGGVIRLSTESAGDRVRLVVESDGPVLDPVQVGRLGRPFQRLGTARTGTGSGLGLSIVSAVAAAHGGTVSLQARPAGGLRVAIDLPAAEVTAVPA